MLLVSTQPRAQATVLTRNCRLYCYCICEKRLHYCRWNYHIRGWLHVCLSFIRLWTPIETLFRGLQLLTQIVIADTTTLKWRGLASGLVFLPFVINGFVGSNISAQVMEKSGWRWGCEPLLCSLDVPPFNANDRWNVCYPCASYTHATDCHAALGRVQS
jgi:hypothetical protein